MKSKFDFKKYWWIGLLTVVVIINVLLFIRPRPAVELRNIVEKENKALKKEIGIATKRIELLRQDSVNLRKVMAEKQNQFILERKADQARYKNLKSKYEKINFSNATTEQLDSIRAILYH